MGSGCSMCKSSVVRIENKFEKIKHLEQDVICLQFDIAQDWLRVIELLQNPNIELSQISNTQIMSTMKITP